MFKSIYKKLKEDFAFLSDYGFTYKFELKHFEVPSILYERNILEIEIGFNYRVDKFYINVSINKDYRNAMRLLDNVALPGKTYKEQVEIVKKYLRVYLDDVSQND